MLTPCCATQAGDLTVNLIQDLQDKAAVSAVEANLMLPIYAGKPEYTPAVTDVKPCVYNSSFKISATQDTVLTLKQGTSASNTWLHTRHQTVGEFTNPPSLAAIVVCCSYQWSAPHQQHSIPWIH